MEERAIMISPDGDQIIFLSSGDDWRLELGNSPKMVRAAHVRFDNEKGVWYVAFRSTTESGQIVEIRMVPTFATRQEALEYEIKLCEWIMTESPGVVDEMLVAQQQLGSDSG